MSKISQKLPKLHFTDANGQPFPDWEEKQLGELTESPSYGMNAPANHLMGNINISV